MKELISIFLITLVCLSCKNSEDSNKSTSEDSTSVVTNTSGQGGMKILPLGNSITHLYTYRYRLWKKLLDAQYSHEFIGLETDGGPTYEDYLGQKFSNIHQSQSGITTTEVAEELSEWLSQLDAPDMALIHLGTNDAEGIYLQESSLANVESAMRNIIEQLRTKNAQVKIFLALIIPLNTEFPTQNDQVPEINKIWAALAQELSTESSPIITVDCNTGFTLEDLVDPWHPNEQGSEKIAQAFSDAILGSN